MYARRWVRMSSHIVAAVALGARLGTPCAEGDDSGDISGDMIRGVVSVEALAAEEEV